MLYFITREKNQSIFDQFVAENTIAISKNIRNGVRLDVFSKTEMRNLHAVTYFAVDIKAVKMSGIEELNETLQCFRLLNPESQVIIVANDPEIETELVFDLKRNAGGNYILLTEDDKEKLQEEISRTLIRHLPRAEAGQDVMDAEKDNDTSESLDNKEDRKTFFKQNIKQKHTQNMKNASKQEEHKSEDTTIDINETKQHEAILAKNTGEYTDVERLIEKAERAPDKISEEKPIYQMMEEQVLLVKEEEEGKQEEHESRRKEAEQGKLVPFFKNEEKQKRPPVKNIYEMFDIPSAVHPEKESGQPDYIWECSDVMIGVAGAEKRSGASTVAFHLVEYLSEMGAKVSYSEADESGHLKTIAEAYNFQKDGEDQYQRNNVIYCSNGEIQTGMNFIVVDFGLLNEKSIYFFRSGKFGKSILVSDYKPYLRKQINNLTNMLPDCCKIFNFLTEEETLVMKEEWNEETILSLSYAPSFVNREKGNDWIYQIIIEEYIKRKKQENKNVQDKLQNDF